MCSSRISTNPASILFDISFATQRILVSKQIACTTWLAWPLLIWILSWWHAIARIIGMAWWRMSSLHAWRHPTSLHIWWHSTPLHVRWHSSSLWHIWVHASSHWLLTTTSSWILLHTLIASIFHSLMSECLLKLFISHGVGSNTKQRN